ncbi:NepR family anti-sigma factor [Mesobacterium pallidum]|uniref:NepR family anti-sigma factor n=1 Tax=Mesobacterium pallidum TaxID=2872037 RepID=UPI001EE19DDB|nr:NepR family anti-sigma factor [Mesobacterium pallidum]
MGKTNAKTNLESQIEENLRKVYQRTVEEDVPDRFKDLLSRLKAMDGEQPRHQEDNS